MTEKRGLEEKFRKKWCVDYALVKEEEERTKRRKVFAFIDFYSIIWY